MYSVLSCVLAAVFIATISLFLSTHNTSWEPVYSVPFLIPLQAPNPQQPPECLNILHLCIYFNSISFSYRQTRRSQGETKHYGYNEFKALKSFWPS